VEEVIIEGAQDIPLNRVRRDLGVKPGDVVNDEKIEQDRQKILTLYEDRNYSDVNVQYRVEEIPGKNRARVIFAITEGPKLIVKKIVFNGNDSVLSKDLRAVMKTKPLDILTFFNKSGRLTPSQVEEDRDAIRTLYQNRGFADVDVAQIETQPLEKGGVELVVNITEGTQYRVNNIAVDGVNIVPAGEVSSLLKMNAGQLFTPKGMSEDIKAMRDFYGSRGYVDMTIAPEVLPAGPGAVRQAPAGQVPEAVHVDERGAHRGGGGDGGECVGAAPAGVAAGGAFEDGGRGGVLVRVSVPVPRHRLG
jgi:outer membrane protein insertion porin family